MNFAGAGLQVDPIAAQDPAYLAFMRGAGYSEAETLAELARKQGSLTRQIDRAAPRFRDELRQAEQGVKDDYGSRGLYRSGRRMEAQVDAGNVVRRNETEFRAGIADQRGDLIANAMQQNAALRRQAADEALTARQTAAINAANASGSTGPVTGHASDPYTPPGGVFGAPAPSNAPSPASQYAAFRRQTLTQRPGTRGPVAM